MTKIAKNISGFLASNLVLSPKIQTEHDVSEALKDLFWSGYYKIKAEDRKKVKQHDFVVFIPISCTPKLTVIIVGWDWSDQFIECLTKP